MTPPVIIVGAFSGDNTYRILVTARWDEGGAPLEVSAETLRYAGAYLPVN